MVMVYAEGFERYNMLDLESHGFDQTDIEAVRYTNVPDPRYEGLNRAQRRKAMAVEARAFRKQKGRKRG